MSHRISVCAQRDQRLYENDSGFPETVAYLPIKKNFFKHYKICITIMSALHNGFFVVVVVRLFVFWPLPWHVKVSRPGTEPKPR